MNERVIPQHIAVIMDGNGRWATRRGWPRMEGHRVGANAVKTMIKCCLNAGVPVLSLFAFSSENWTRPAVEVDFLMQLFLEALQKEVEELHKHGILLRFIGCRDNLSPPLQAAMARAEAETAGNSALTLQVAINYGGRWDIVQAVQKLAREVEKGQLTADAIDESRLAAFLSTATYPEPDLFIRTSGEQRISNFFLWSLAYTELYFSNTDWPDFSEADFEAALTSFSQRQRRYGGVSSENACYV